MIWLFIIVGYIVLGIWFALAIGWGAWFGDEQHTQATGSDHHRYR